MKRSLVILTVVLTIAAVMLCGCRAANRVPGVSAVASVIPTLPYVSPSPIASVGALTAAPSPSTPLKTVAPR